MARGMGLVPLVSQSANESNVPSRHDFDFTFLPQDGTASHTLPPYRQAGALNHDY